MKTKGLNVVNTTSAVNAGPIKGTAERRKYFSSQWVIPFEDFSIIRGTMMHIKWFLEAGEVDLAQKYINETLEKAEELWQAKYTAIEVLNARMNQLEDKSQKALDFYIKAASPKTGLKSMSSEEVLEMFENIAL